NHNADEVHPRRCGDRGLRFRGLRRSGRRFQGRRREPVLRSGARPMTDGIFGSLEHDLSNSPDALSTDAQGRLRALVERIGRLEEDKQAIQDDIKEVFAEAKGEGFDTKMLRQVIRIRKKDKAKRQEEEAILDLYLAALGDI